MSLLIIDNYDSFTYNIVHALRQLGVQPTVKRNDHITVAEALNYDSIIISPGPGIPSEAGIITALLPEAAQAGKKILGVCLGHQTIGEAFGARLVNLPKVYHGLQTYIKILDASDPLFSGLPEVIKVGRYHSWAVDTKDFPDSVLQITSVDGEGHIMSLRHRFLPIFGVQFHPESILTPNGDIMLKNWLNI